MSRSLRRAIVTELGAPASPSFDLAFWHSLSGLEWSHVLDWLDLSGLALYFWQKMKSQHAENALPSFVQERLARCYEENCVRVAAIRREFSTLNDLFDDAGVQYAALKGLALVPHYCPEPAHRTQYDHDYLIGINSLARAEAVLHRSGYKPRFSGGNRHLVYFRPAPDAFPSEPQTSLYSAGLERSIELHVRLWDRGEEYFEVELPEDLLERGCRRSWQGLEYWDLSDEDGLIVQVLHSFRHILHNWCRLSVFLEISHFLRQRTSDPDFWARYRNRISKLRWVPEASAVVFKLTQELFGGYAPAGLSSMIQPRLSSILDEWIQRYGVSGALDNFCGNKSSLFLHREFVTDRSMWAEVRRRRLLPFHRPHQLPEVLFNHGPSGLRRRLAQHLHGLRRLKFHAFSAVRYACESPRWQFHRMLRTPAGSKAGSSANAEKGNRESEPSLEPVVTQLRKTVIRD